MTPYVFINDVYVWILNDSNGSIRIKKNLWDVFKLV